MESLDADDFFREKVGPHLDELEGVRRGLASWILLAGAGVVGGVLMLALARLPVPGIALFVVGVGAAIRANALHARLRASFKEIVMRNLIAALDPAFAYDPGHHIAAEIYRASRIFRTGYDRYQGDDLVSGRIDGIDFRFSELHTEYKTTTTDSKGNRQTTWHTIFQGIFFVADFHKHFAGVTFVLPDTAQALLGEWLGQGLQSLASGHGDIVKLESPEFEQAFVTYSSDQQEARYILSPALMERMLELRRRFGVQLHFAFVGECIYVAIGTGRSHFEPRIFRSGVSAADVREHLALLRSLVGIVRDLGLDRRIWTKE